MTQDEIIEMAKEANIQDAYSRSPHKGVIAQLEAFAKLIAAKEQKKWEDQTVVEIHEAVLEEREACANLCWKNEDDNAFVNKGGKRLDLLCAELIRARAIEAKLKQKNGYAEEKNT